MNLVSSRAGESSKRAKPVILYVEDDDALRLVTCEMLQDEGFECVVASNGADAKQLIDGDCRYDILLSDIRMPRSPNGVQLAHLFKSICPERAVLLISGGFDMSEEDIPFPLLLKPVGANRLVSEIRRLLIRNREAGQRRADL
jgi:two-component system cell cycle response regulator CpdR